MPIKFKCPHCQRGLSVKEHLAGKTAKCPACKQMLKIPAPVPAPPDAEELAMSVLQDKPAEAPVEAPKTIDFTCPQCDEPVQAPIDLGGKQMPCPHCKRIIKVPVPEKKAPDDWRQKTAGPSAARQTLEPKALEGAWTPGTTAAHRESLEEAGAIPEEPERLTVGQRIVRYGVPAVILLLLVSGVLWAYHVSTQSKEARAVTGALDLGKKVLEGKPEAQGALHRAAGEFYLRTEKRGCAAKAMAEFRQARAALERAPATRERDLLLIELALTQVDLGGTQAEVDNGTRWNWVRAAGNKLAPGDAGVDREILQTLEALRAPEAQLLAVREVGRKLIAKGQPQVAAALPGVLPPDSDLRPEAEAQVGLELFRTDPKRAEAAATQALGMLERGAKDAKGPPPAAPPALVALCLALNKPELTAKLPRDAQAGAQSDKPVVVLGVIEGLGLQGDIDAARQPIGRFSRADQLQARLVLAEALIDKEPGAAKVDVREAVKVFTDTHRASPWQVVRLIDLGGRTGLDGETLKQLAGTIQDPGLRAWALLEALRAQLAADKGKKAGPESFEAIDAVAGPGKYTAAAFVAREAVARHNARLDGGTLNEVRKWDEVYRPFGIVGAVLGGQGR
jgi:hypothetical protein